MRKEIKYLFTIGICLSITSIFYKVSSPEKDYKDKDQDFKTWPSEIQKKYIEWSWDYGKVGQSPEEVKKRREIWYNNYINLEKYKKNSKSFKKKIWKLTLTEFGDLTDEEFVFKISGVVGLGNEAKPNNFVKFDNPADLEIDWSSKFGREPIYQGFCKASWAIVTSEALDIAYQVQTGQKEHFSAQQLLDCTPGLSQDGCKGGTIQKAFNYILKQNGLAKEKDYLYTGVAKSCRNSLPQPNLEMKEPRLGYVFPKNEKEILKGLRQGPVIAHVNALCLKNYKNGIFNSEDVCSSDEESLNHSVLIVGAGIENGIKFWKVRNTWGEEWGERGYFRVERIGGDGLMGINVYPLVFM